jgi:hypothetical protein
MRQPGKWEDGDILSLIADQVPENISLDYEASPAAHAIYISGRESHDNSAAAGAHALSTYSAHWSRRLDGLVTQT